MSSQIPDPLAVILKLVHLPSHGLGAFKSIPLVLDLHVSAFAGEPFQSGIYVPYSSMILLVPIVGLLHPGQGPGRPCLFLSYPLQSVFFVSYCGKASHLVLMGGGGFPCLFTEENYYMYS